MLLIRFQGENTTTNRQAIQFSIRQTVADASEFDVRYSNETSSDHQGRYRMGSLSVVPIHWPSVYRHTFNRRPSSDFILVERSQQLVEMRAEDKEKYSRQ